MRIDEFLARLNGVRSRGLGKWTAKCAAHSDTNPSLSICEAGTRILLRCFGGCETPEIVAALGLEMRDLFTDAPNHHAHRLNPKPVKIDHITLVFRFELAALDRRLRADRIIAAAKTLDASSLSDAELDRALSAVAQAHADVERAKLFETVADDLRLKSFTERDHARQDRVA